MTDLYRRSGEKLRVGKSAILVNKSAYDRAAQDLAARFNKNFSKFNGVAKEIAAAAPM